VRAALLLAAIAVAFYWKLTLRPGFTFLDSPDTAYMILPWYQFQARAWHTGSFPLWDPYQWCGQPLLGQMQPGAAFPLNWPLFWAPLQDGGINLNLFHWHFVLMHWLAALFMYLYCRELGRSRTAAILAGCGFSFGGFVGTVLWPQLMNGAVWTPLMFLFHHRAGRAETRISAAANAAGCGASIGMALLAGHHQAQMFVILALTGVFLAELAASADRLRRIGGFAVTAAFAALVGGLILLPAWEYGSRAYRWVNLPTALRLNQKIPYLGHEPFGVAPLTLLGTLTPVDQATTNPLVGVAAVALALLAACACWNMRDVRVHSCLALAGLAFTVGKYSVFHGLMYVLVPFLDKARTSSQALIVFHFGLLVAAAHGLDALREPTPWAGRLSRGLGAAAVLAGVAQLYLSVSGAGVSGRSRSLLFSAVIALALALCIRFRFRAGAVVLLLGELGAGTAYLIRPRSNPENPNYLDRLAQHAGVIQFLQSQPRPFRVDVDDVEIPYNLGDWAGLEAAAGYLASVNADLLDFIGLNWTRTALMLNHVYVVGREKKRPEQVEVFAEPGGLKVFRNPDAYPRVWLTGEVRAVTDRDAAAALMQSADFDPRRETFLFGGAPEWAPCDPVGSAEVTAQETHRTAARVKTNCRAMVVFGDPMFPGWRARVDGAPAEMYAAYGALRGVVVPPGDHRVEVEYRPRSVYAGAALTLIGFAGCLALALMARRTL